ncbi:MAG: hypothetical protein ACT4PZ_10325 [Panacagrimonas sp.]
MLGDARDLGGGNSPRFLPGRWGAAVAVLLAGLAPIPATAWTLKTELSSFAYNEPVPVSNYLQDWDGPLESGSDGITRNTLFIGATQGPWQVGYVQRYDWEIKASRDMARLYFEASNKRDLTPGREYALDLRIFHQRSQGIRLAYEWSGADWSLSLGASALDGITLTQGRLHGKALVVGEKDYEYQAQVAYGYTKDFLFGRHARAPEGLGLSTDLKVRWRPTPAYLIELRIDDLWGRLWWRDVPYTDAVATSQTERRDEDGYVVFDPTLSGRESFRSMSQRLHPAAQLQARYTMNDRDEFGLGADASEVQLIPEVFWRRHLGGTLMLGAQAFPGQAALGFEGQAGPFKLRYASDALSFNDAHFLRVELSLGVQF